MRIACLGSDEGLFMKKYRVKVDRTLCIGAASCTAVAPKTFALDTEGKSVIKKKDGTTTTEFVEFESIDDTPENILAAAKVCPVNAIVIEEISDDGNVIAQVWPQV